jgi:SSS family solute:Na+ symporter
MAIGYVMIVDHTGPADWWATAATHTPHHTRPPLFSWDVTVRVTIFTAIINNFFWTICTHGADQVVLQRYFSTASLKAARRSYVMNLVVDLSMATLLALCGLALLAFYLRHGELLPPGVSPLQAADKLFPHFLGHQLPAGCAGLIMSAFLCDAIQTLESGVNAITAVVTNDVVPRLRHGQPRVVSDLAFARLLSIVVTVLVSANAYLVANLAQHLTIVDMMPKFFNMFVGPLAALFVIGMFLPRCTTRSALPAVFYGLIVSIMWSWYREIFGGQARPTILLAIAVPCLSTIGIAAVLSWLLEKGGPHPGQRFTWFAIVRGGKSSEMGHQESTSEVV